MGAKALQPKLSLGTLFITVLFLDLLWPTLLLLNIEQVGIVPGITSVAPLDFYHYPFSHSFLMATIWSVIFGGIYFVFSKNRRGALILVLCVFSHWMLDLIVHRPDLPLIPGGNIKVGLGLWYSLIGTILLESALYVLGIWFYIKQSKKNKKVIPIGFWFLALSIYIVYLLNIFGPVPLKVNDIAWGAQLQWLFVIWAYWIDRKKRVPLSA